MSARNIIKYLSKVQVKMSSFDANASGASELYRQLTSPKCVAANPKCDVSFDVIVFGSKPELNLKFIDGREEKLDVVGVEVRELMKRINYTCIAIESDLEAQGKSIDNM